MNMAMNPAMLFKIKSAWDKFVNNHPKFPMFLRAASATGIKEGYIIEVKITDTGERRYVPTSSSPFRYGAH